MTQIQNFSPNLNPDQPTYGSKPKKKRKKLKIFLIILLVIVVLPSIIFFVPIIGYYPLHFIGKALTKPFDDSDLRLNTVEINPEDNGFYLKQEAEKYLVEVNNINSSELLKDVFEKNKWNEKAIQDILGKNQKAIAIFNQIADKKYFQGPDFYHLDDNDFESLARVMPLIELARLTSLKSLTLARQGSYKAAWSQALTMLSVGDKIADSQGLIAHNLCGIVIKKTALYTIQKMIIDNSYYDEEIDYKNIIQKIRKHDKSFDSAVKSLKIEFENFVPIVKKELGRDKDSPRQSEIYYYFSPTNRQLENYYYFNPTNSKKLLADFVYRPAISIFQEKKCKNSQEFKNKLDKSFSHLTVSPLERGFRRIVFNFLGKNIVNNFTINWGFVVKKFCLDTTSNSLIQTSIALANFKNQNGQFPNSLDDLTPEFIGKIPKDTFSGESLRYLPKKGIIYSVGTDNIDNGGNPDSDIIIDIQNPTFEIY